MSDPLFIADADVLGVIAKDDEILASITTGFQSLTPDQQAKGAAQIAAWVNDANAYDQWAHNADKSLSDPWTPALAIPGTGIKYHSFGARLYTDAIAWGDRLLVHAKDVQALGGGLGALPDLPSPPSLPNVLPNLAIGDDTKLLIGAGLLLGLILALRH